MWSVLVDGQGRVRDFLASDPDAVVNALATRVAEAFSGRHKEQIEAWREQVQLLRSCFEELAKWRPGSSDWGLALEYPLLRLGRRIDAVVITSAVVAVLEFKIGAKSHSAGDQRQVEDYALDLREFHALSHRAAIAPVLVATRAPVSDSEVSGRSDEVWKTICACSEDLSNKLRQIEEVAAAVSVPINPIDWLRAHYEPTPTVLEAARSLFAGHGVSEIADAASSRKNLAQCADAIAETVEDAKREKSLSVCFVTGAPGAGKTLAGLNVVHDPRITLLGPAAYLSGTRPLVEVVRRALAQDHVERSGASRKQADQAVQSEIQLLMGFLEEYLREGKSKAAPHERVIVFDEAQRAWDAATGLKRFKRSASEPALFLEIMARHADWAVILALVGSGQEINRGEGGLRLWGEALQSWHCEHPQRPWRVTIGGGTYGGGALTELRQDSRLHAFSHTRDSRLDLAVSQRSYRCPEVNQWVEAVLRGDPRDAKKVASQDGFPVFLTRSLVEARGWLQKETRGERRCGLLASSGAKRLRAEGLGVALRSEDLAETANWFLKPPDDIRSSHALEVTASEYTCQGLELDFSGVCWGGDLLWDPVRRNWVASRLSGPKWHRVRKDLQREYTLNKYRVLMTRARRGMIIWVPLGDALDSTRAPAPYHATAQLFAEAGAKELGRVA